MKTLHSERLAIRELRDEDVDALFSIFSDAEVMAHWSSAPWTDRAEAHELIAQIRGAHDLMQWGIARRDDDRVIGTCTLFAINLPHKRCEVGYILGRESWGKGIAYEAVSRVLRYAFEEMDLHRIEADVDPRNASSIKLLERLGFQREGYARERWHVASGIYDAWLYGLLRREARFL